MRFLVAALMHDVRMDSTVAEYSFLRLPQGEHPVLGRCYGVEVDVLFRIHTQYNSLSLLAAAFLLLPKQRSEHFVLTCIITLYQAVTFTFPLTYSFPFPLCETGLVCGVIYL